MDWTKVLSKTPLPTVLVVLGAILAVIAAAAGLPWGTRTLPLDTSGRIGLGFLGLLLCSAGFYMRYRIGERQNAGKKTLKITFDEIRGQGKKDAEYDFVDLTTVDALIDDIYRRHLQGAVQCGSYGQEWILATKGGEKLYDIGSRWAKRQGMEPESGLGVPIDKRAVATLVWFKDGGSFRVQRLETRPIPEPSIRAVALPEFTMIRLKSECKSWMEIGGNDRFERNLDYEFAEDPVFEIAVENNSRNTCMFHKAGIRLVRREPRRGYIGAEWEYRTLEVQTELTVHCPDEWKRMEGVIDDRSSRASTAFVNPIEMNKSGSRYLFTLELENFVDLNSASSSEVRFYLVTGGSRIAESRSIWLDQ